MYNKPVLFRSLQAMILLPTLTEFRLAQQVLLLIALLCNNGVLLAGALYYFHKLPAEVFIVLKNISN